MDSSETFFFLLCLVIFSLSFLLSSFLKFRRCLKASFVILTKKKDLLGEAVTEFF